MLRLQRPFICDFVKKEKETHGSFPGVPQTTHVTATVHIMCLVKMEQVLNLNNKIF